MSNRKSKSTNKPRDHDWEEEEDEMNLETNVFNGEQSYFHYSKTTMTKTTT